jgi:hypothetical protein
MFSLVGAVAWLGHLVPVFEGDQSRLTIAIAALFALGWLACCRAVYRLATDINRSKVDEYEPASIAEADKASIKAEWLQDVSQWLVALGLLGTIIGFTIALSGISEGSVANADGAQNAVASLMQGMRVALNTTLLGASLAIWHEVNTRMFKTGMACFWLDRVRAHNGEITARARRD